MNLIDFELRGDQLAKAVEILITIGRSLQTDLAMSIVVSQLIMTIG